jgi:hydroxyacylglutathione hydrolase
MFFRQIFDPKLAQYAYLIGCQRTGEALVIDPQRDVDRYLEVAAEEGLKIVAVTETHIHADFLSGSRELAHRHGARVYLSDEGDADWKYAWAGDPEVDVTLLQDGDTFRIGQIEIKAVHTPGHTPEHIAFMVTDFGGGADQPMGMVSGDFVFVSDLGRPDLLESAAGVAGMMEPSARTLYRSVQSFLELPDYLQVWPGHGAGSACGKALGAVPETTVGYERRFNAAIAAAGQGEDAFVEAILEGQPEPPLYFARMKKDNKAGPRILGELPRPGALTADELAALAGRTDVAVVDARTDRAAFMAGHLPASLYAPMDRSFNTTVGSYVEPGTAIYLILEAAQVEEAVRDLVRIGLDEIAGYATPATLAAAGRSVALATIEVIDFERAAELASQPSARWLDVRRRSEFDAGHLPGAQNIAHTRLRARAGEVEPGGRQLVYCRTGARAAVASALLARLGHHVAYVDDKIAGVAPRALESAASTRVAATT